MKKQIFLIFFIFCLHSYAEPCGVHSDCPEGKTYPYIMCRSSDGLIHIFCLNDPYTAEPCEFGGFIFDNVRKTNLPICIDFDNSGPDTVWGYVCGTKNQNHEKYYTDIIYTKADFINQSEQIADIWNCICGYQDEPCHCSIKVKFIDKNQNEFSDPETESLSNTLFENNPAKEGQIDENNKYENLCSNIVIFLNHTEEFHRSQYIRDANGLSRVCYDKFYYIDSYHNNHLSNTTYINAYNLNNIIAHELGKILGFGNGNDCTDYDNNSIMFSEIVASTRKSLSQDDICMFKKLYCPELTEIREVYQNINETSIYPNPCRTFVNLPVFAKFENEIISVEITNSISETVFESSPKIYPCGDSKIEIDISNFPNGIYFYKIISQNNVQFGKILKIE